MKSIDTQAGDDSEGKMWGLEGSSLLIVIGGVVIGVIVTVAAFSYWNCPPVIALGYGTLPAVLGIVYVFTLREKRPKSFDKDLLETLICGRSWQHKPSSKPHPLLLSLFISSLIFPASLHAQTAPSHYTNVEHNKDYEFVLLKDEPFGIQVGANISWLATGTLHTVRLFLNGEQVFQWLHSSVDTASGLQMAGFGKNIEGPLKAGTRLRLRGTMEAPQSPSSRIVVLYIYSLSYDAAVHLTGLERKIHGLETSIANLLPRVDQNVLRINELAGQILNLRTELNEFRQRFDALDLAFSQFKTDVISRIDGVDKRISSLEKEFKGQISAVNQRIDTLSVDYTQFKTDTNSRFEAINKRHTSLENKFGTELNGLSQRFTRFQGEQEQQISGINTRLNALDKTFLEKANSFERQLSALERRNLRRDRLNNTLGIIGVSVGGTAALLAAGGAYYQFLQENQENEREKKP